MTSGAYGAHFPTLSIFTRRRQWCWVRCAVDSMPKTYVHTCLSTTPSATLRMCLVPVSGGGAQFRRASLAGVVRARHSCSTAKRSSTYRPTAPSHYLPFLPKGLDVAISTSRLLDFHDTAAQLHEQDSIQPAYAQFPRDSLASRLSCAPQSGV